MKNKIILILKYSYQNKLRPKQKKDGTYKKRGPWRALMAYILPAIIFGGSLAPMMYFMFKELNIPFSQLGINLPWTILDVIFGMWFLLMGFMFFLNYSPAIVANLYESEMTQLLLSMPIRRSSIYIASAIDSLIMAGLPLGMMIPIFAVYALIAKNSIIFSILGGIGFLILLLLISNLGGILFSKFLTKTSAKRWTMIMYFISIFFYVGISNLLPNFANTPPSQLVNALERMSNIILNTFWPHTWVINVMKGSIPFLILLYSTILILSYIIYNLSNTLEFSVSRKKGKKKKAEIKFKSSKFPILKKDFRLLFRDSQTFFLLLYPLFIPIIFMFSSKSLDMISIIFVMIAAIYASMVAIYAISYEGKLWPVPKLYPIKIGHLIFSKAFMPFIIYVVEYIAITILIYLSGKASIEVFWSIIPVILIIMYSSILGISLYLKNPKRDLSQKNIISGKEVFYLEGITLGLGLGIFLPGNLYISSLKNIEIKEQLIDFLFDSTLLYHLIGAVLPLFLLFLTIYLIKREIKKTKERMLKWE
ncbi:hypothetical protein X275_04640 [Marinitoga sp. 1197]|uniref:hypothetical protein n=1 Tax=Marinitoga sp. 1197 TaxID=1428449 RepID=UPI0006414961|nr:hypothetical protein [Marinitoga sp. 1197]KLO22848.1 hypothetical protein X275_04640 [Marinitoga sp. 1197]